MKDILSKMKKAPWNAFLKLADYIGKKYFTVGWPEEVPTLNISILRDDLEEILRFHHFEGTEMTYTYEGEVLNLRRPELHDDNGDQFEVHARARNKHEGPFLDVIMHIEYSRYEHPEEHIAEDYLRWLSEEEIRQVIEDGAKVKK